MSAYGTIGPYKGGYWLVEKGGASALVRQDKLPKEGQGFRYYFLGSTEKKVKERFSLGVGAFGFDVGNVQFDPQVFHEAATKGVSSNITNPGGFSFSDALIYGAAGVAGVAGIASRAAGGAAAGAEGAAGGAAGAEGAAGGGAAGAAAGKAATSTVSSALKDTGIVAAVGLLIGHYGIRLLEILAGGALILFGLVTLARGGEAPKTLPVPV